MDSSFGKEGILSRLRLLDEDLDFRFGGARRFELVISGGSALSIRGLIPSRVTTDIDVLSVPDEVVDLMSAYDMNSHVDTFRYMYPTHWHDRIRPVEFDGSVLDVYTLGNEDLAITKLLSWRGDKDRRDLENMWSNGSINHSALNSILLDITEVRINITEAQWNLLNQRIAVLDGRDPFSSDTSTTFGFPSFSSDDQPSPELDAPLIRPYDWRSFVRRPNFEPWSRRYLLHLSGLSRFDFPRLCVMACHSEGRLREPLLLYALQSDRFPELMAMTDDSKLRGEYEHAADSLGELAPQDYALEHGYDPSTGDRYRKVLNSFYADWHRPETLARSKSIRRDACLRAKRERGVPVAPICRELGLNVGNVNAWLKNGDMSKVSLENATRLARAFRAA
ncbi:DUF6036 family nucleotidyltransferase [Bifidobacterium longum]